jgi:ubiquinol-cytochrome c reductase cytochrome b subunit
MGKFLSWLDARLPLTSLWNKYFIEYFVPKNLNLFYLFGILGIVVLANQLVTGLWLTMFYTPSTEHAFTSIEYIMRDVSFGWLFRYMHSTGASAFFIVMYLHMFRGLLYGSYQKPRELVWFLGMVLYFLLIMEAFFGYLLPWGQMSYWGAQVITSLVSALPYIGDSLVIWIRGDYSVSNVTLQRFFAMHVIGLPLILLTMVILHIVALRHVGSNNPEGVEIKAILDVHGKPVDGIPFHPYYTIKDCVGIVLFGILFFAVVFFTPKMGGYFLEPNNYVPANPLITPDDIVPMWYMAPFYALLRAIPNQFIGVGLMGLALFFLFLIPWLDKSLVRSMRYKGIYSRLGLWFFIISFLVLGYLGTIPVTPIRLLLARISVVIYFSYFLLMPYYTKIEVCRPVPLRIVR